jgi:DNA-binding beta-propeller fold protein YncE
VHSVAVGGEPSAIAVNSRTNTVFVTGARAVTVIDGRSGGVTHRLAAGSRTRGIAVDAVRNTVYATTNGGGLVAIDGRTLHTAHMLTLGVKPNGVAVDGSTGSIVVANGFDANVSVVADDPVVGTS